MYIRTSKVAGIRLASPLENHFPRRFVVWNCDKTLPHRHTYNSSRDTNRSIRFTLGLS